MATQVSLLELGPVDFIPRAVVRCPIAYFSDRLGFAIEKDIDDFDEYESAFFRAKEIIIKATKQGMPFALIHYRGNPSDTTTIYLNRDLPEEIIPTFVKIIVREFGLKHDVIEWTSADNVPPPLPLTDPGNR